MTTTTDLDLAPVHRVQALPQSAVNPLLDLVAAHFLEHGQLGRDTFLMLASEAEANASW